MPTIALLEDLRVDISTPAMPVEFPAGCQFVRNLPCLRWKVGRSDGEDTFMALDHGEMIRLFGDRCSGSRKPEDLPEAKKKTAYTMALEADGWMRVLNTFIAAGFASTTKKSARCKTTLEWGAVRIEWPADTDYGEAESYTWTVLKAEDWRKEGHLGWRYAASELERRAEAARAKRARVAEP